MSESTNQSAPAGPTASAGRLGRRAGVILFWLMTTFLIGTSARSIIPSLYFPDAAPRPRAPDALRCARELSALQHEMTVAAAESLRAASIAPWRSHQTGWDGRLQALNGGCGELERTRQDVLRLRDKLDALLVDYGERAMPYQQRVRGALAALPESGST